MSSRDAADTPGRRRSVRALLVAAVLLAILALVLSYLGRAVLTPGPFADRAVATLRDPAVRDDVADRLTEAVTRDKGGDLVAVRPVVRSLAGAVLGGRAFAALFRRAVIEAHNAVVQRGDGRLLVRVADAGVLIQGVLERFAPAAARRIGAERVATLLTLRPGSAVLGLVRDAKRVYSAAWILAVLALLTAGGAVWISPDRRRALRQVAIGMLAAGLAIVVLLTLGREIAEQAAPAARGAAVGAVWGAFLDGLRVQALVLAVAGALCAGAAAGWLRGVGTEAPAAQEHGPLRRIRTAPRRSPAAALLFTAGGAAILLEPAATVRVLVLALGLLVLSLGVDGVLRAVVAGAGKPAAGAVARVRRVGRFAPVVLAVGALAGAVALIIEGSGDEAPAVTPQTCNGFVALCSRPLNDVALAATHNSMASVTIPHWLFGQQDGTIADQLDHGIRGLLIDTYYGFGLRDNARTDLERLPKRAVAVREFGAAAVDAALRIRSRIGRQGAAQRRIYLCHGFCEIGAITLDSALSDLRSFLVANPGEVVVVINQDEGVPASDIERAFSRAGLLDLVYRGPLGPFPTLRSMIDSGQRLVVMAENDAGTVPWYRLAYRQALQETPFQFNNPAELTDDSRLPASCRPNRGPASAPLFLLNHWVDTTPAPRPSLAATVNARAALLARAETCQRIRRHLPNLVAVDFYRRGDVVGVVNTLNGVARGHAS
jgi:hypothetical protein